MNPDNKTALEIAEKIAGHYVKVKAVERMLRMATSQRNKLTEEAILDRLAESSLSMGAGDVCFDPKDSSSCKLLKTLRQLQVTHEGFKWIVQLGQPTDDALRRWIHAYDALIHSYTRTRFLLL